MIELKDLCKSYGDKAVLKELSCTFESGNVYSIVAPNGTGKTTLISILSGLLVQTSGDVIFSDGNSEKDTFLVPAGEKTLYAKNTVKENAFYVGRIRGKSTKEILNSTDFLRKCFPIYNEVFNTLVERLSFGQKRLVSLLNAVIANPSCIIIDEVSEGLDVAHTAMLVEMIEFLKKDRIVIIASHDYDFVSDVSDFNWFLKNGTFVQRSGRLSKEEILICYNKHYEVTEVSTWV